MAAHPIALRLACSMLRLLVFMLVFPLASVGMLPVWAALGGGEAPHVCHCSLDHHECVCARCHTDPDEHPATESIAGQCGDDAPAVFGAKAFIAVSSAVVGDLLAIDPPSVDIGLVVNTPRSRERMRPSTPPPRRAG